MQLRIQRSQRAGGVLGNTVFFSLDVRGDYSPEEQSNIRKYKLGSQIIYSSPAAQRHAERANAHLDRVDSDLLREKAAGLARGGLSAVMARLSLNISIASLGRGHHIECKDLEELLEAEDTVRGQCKNVTRYLDVAATFDGSEVIIDYENGEERVHIAQTSVPLIQYTPPTMASEQPVPAYAQEFPTLHDAGQEFRAIFEVCRQAWISFEQKIVALARTKGWSVTAWQVRAAGGVTSLLALILLYEIF